MGGMTNNTAPRTVIAARSASVGDKLLTYTGALTIIETLTGSEGTVLTVGDGIALNFHPYEPVAIIPGN